MKKILAFLLILTACQPIHIVLDEPITADRAIGWQDMYAKYNYRDSTTFDVMSEFEDGARIGDYKDGSDVVVLDSVTTDGTNVYFYNGATILTAVPGVGSAAWGSISGTLTNQVDLTNALGLKANIASPTFTGTVGGITAAMVGAMSTSHAANAITGANIANWNTAFGWGNHAGLYELAGSLASYVPITRTVNGHALNANVSVTASDVSLGNLTNKLQVELEDSVNYVNGYMSRYDGVTGLALKLNISDTASMLTNYVNKTDTTAMLTPYINRADTATMLLRYINKADTASALLNYILESEVASGYLPIANPTATGTLTTPILKVGNSASNTITSIDSISKVTGATDISFYDGADTLNPYIPYAKRIDLYDAMDTTTTISTIWNVREIVADSLALYSGGLTSGEVATQINDSLTARLSAAVTGVRLVDSSAVAEPNSYATGNMLEDGLALKVTTAKTYYVSSAGNDSNTGLSDAQAWLTVAKVNASTFNPGDIIKFKAGGTWRETLTIPSSGTDGYPITFTSYGTGEKPIITGANVFASWTQEGSNYYTAFTVSPKFVFKAGVLLDSAVVEKASLSGNEFWRDVPNSRIYIVGNPSGSTMEMTVRDDAVNTNQKNYIVIDGLHLTNTNANGINGYVSRFNTYKNNTIDYITSKGIYVNYQTGPNTQTTIEDNILNHIQGHCIEVYGGLDIIRRNTITNIGDYYSTATPAAQYPAGILIDVNTATGVLNTQIYDNVIDELDGDGSLVGSHGMYIQYGTSGLNIYGNKISDIREGDGIKMAGSGTIYNNIINSCYFAGVGIHNYTGTEVVTIYNNVFYNNGYGVQQNDQTGTLSLSILNNTFYKNGITSPTSDNSEIYIHDNLTSLIIKDNVIYPSNSQLAYFYRVHATAFESNYNIFYREDAGNFMNDAGTSRTFAAWQGEGYDANSLNSNPLLISSSDLRLLSGSPAINSGTTTTVTTDILGNSRVGNYDMGAYEKQAEVWDGYVALADSVNYPKGYMSRYDGVTGLAGKVAIADTADMLDPYFTETEIRKVDSDTIPLFVFGAGSGATADTALFNNDRLIGAFFNSGSDTLHVTALRGVLKAGTGTETIAVQVSWDVNLLDGSPTNLNTSAYTVTSMTAGDEDTSFNNNDIPPNVWVWGTLSGASANNKPTFLSLTMTGYKRNRSY